MRLVIRVGRLSFIPPSSLIRYDAGSWHRMIPYFVIRGSARIHRQSACWIIRAARIRDVTMKLFLRFFDGKEFILRTEDFDRQDPKVGTPM